MNPVINFRLSKDHLAKGLEIICSLEPNYQPTSISKIVKVIFLDYLAKMSLNKKDSINPKYMNIIESLISKKENPIKDFTSFQEENNPSSEEKSIITSVSDFSPPISLGE